MANQGLAILIYVANRKILLTIVVWEVRKYGLLGDVLSLLPMRTINMHFDIKTLLWHHKRKREFCHEMKAITEDCLA